MSVPTYEQLKEARETIRICEATGLYAGSIYRTACDVVSEFMDALSDEELIAWQETREGMNR